MPQEIKRGYKAMLDEANAAIETQRDAFTVARQRGNAATRNVSYSPAHSVGLDGRVEMCTGF